MKTDEIIGMMKMRQKTMQRHISIHVLNGGIREKQAKKKKKWLNEKFTEIERRNISDPVGKNKGRKENKKGKKLYAQIIPTGCIKSKDGMLMIENKKKILEICKEYVVEIFLNVKGERTVEKIWKDRKYCIQS